jgi:hypothetical protein
MPDPAEPCDIVPELPPPDEPPEPFVAAVPPPLGAPLPLRPPPPFEVPLFGQPDATANSTPHNPKAMDMRIDPLPFGGNRRSLG